MVSYKAYDETMKSAQKYGAKGFLFKPFTQESLISGIEGALTQQ
jgi:FixJ family two-component response regulator